MATNTNTFSWAGSAYATNPLAGGGKYDPRRPSILTDTQEEDALVRVLRERHGPDVHARVRPFFLCWMAAGEVTPWHDHAAPTNRAG